MMLRIAACALLVILPSAVYAEDPTPLDIATLVCVGPGYMPAGDPYEVIAGLPEKNCMRACKAAAQGCKAVVKAIDRCGVSFLKAAAKTGMEVCRGHGGDSQQCRGGMGMAKSDMDSWRAQGKLEQAACDSDAETFCMSRCQSEAMGPSTPLQQNPENPQMLGGVVMGMSQ